MKNTKYLAVVSSLIAWLAAGTVIFHSIEDWTWIQSFYFSVISLTTVGYGDMVPTSDMSRLITSFYILIGVAIVVASLGVIGKAYLERREGKIKKRFK